jgi:hypothetical protein
LRVLELFEMKKKPRTAYRLHHAGRPIAGVLWSWVTRPKTALYLYHSRLAKQVDSSW